jgi:hypothetical protein
VQQHPARRQHDLTALEQLSPSLLLDDLLSSGQPAGHQVVSLSDISHQYLAKYLPDALSCGHMLDGMQPAEQITAPT